jgi:hypothetical protein
MHRRYTTRPDATAAASAEQSTLSPPSLDNFFSKSALVVNKRKFNRERGQLHFIFLEGLPGTGKQGVLWRLNKMGFKIHVQSYLEHCARTNTPPTTPSATNTLSAHSSLFAPLTAATSLTWLSDLARALEAHQTQYQRAPEQYKSDVLFVHRSPLSPVLHGHDWAHSLALEILHHWSPTLLMCHSDPIRQLERLAERNADSEAPLQHLRAQFRELDQEHLATLRARLHKLNESAVEVEYAPNGRSATSTRWFDFVLPTTDTKQATAQILTSCGFEFQNIFNNPFKK